MSNRKPFWLSTSILGLASCTSMGPPHIGTVDTRLRDPGTVVMQSSVGAGISIVSGAAGATMAADTYLSSRLSLATSAQLLFASPIEDASFFPAARLGLRLRLSPRFSLGAGAMGSLAFAIPRLTLSDVGYGGDLELATSRTRARGRFASHAWRFALGHSPQDGDKTYALMGDWSRSRPTRNKNIRLVFGLNYGLTAYTRGPEPPRDCRDGVADCHGPAFPDEGPGLYLGVNIGVLWGNRPWRLGVERGS